MLRLNLERDVPQERMNINELAHAILGLIASLSSPNSEPSNDTVETKSLAKYFAARTLQRRNIDEGSCETGTWPHLIHVAAHA